MEGHTEESRAMRRRAAVAVVGAVLIHIALLLAVTRAADHRTRGESIAVELRIVGGAAAQTEPMNSSNAAPPRPAHAEPEGDVASVRPERGDRHGAATRENLPVAMPAAQPPAVDAGVGESPRSERLDLALGWNGFERTFGTRAAQDRADYEQALRRKRIDGQRATRWSQLVLGALGDNRRYPEDAPLTATEARRAVEGYLSVLNSRITPTFNAFLAEVGLPADQLHGAVQRSWLRYNPFYVPPPIGEIVDTTSVLAKVERAAQVEFAIGQSGALDEIRLVATSGSGFFDATAVSAICTGSPFPPPPAAIRSAREHAYFAWRFDKDWHLNGRGSARHLVVREFEPLSAALDGGTPAGE
ncbi:MAG: TonB C-terminal domain-containing protein [Proteobacteria bacterium]|nr:TonB C-terminal domain-containing protein [Pseudomonadota bacterium]